VLGLVGADTLFRRHPSAPEGILSRTRSHVVSAENLARRARELGLGPVLRLGHGEEHSGGRDKQSVLADALEAVIGAVFVDGGPEAARAMLAPWVEREASEAMDVLDAKSNLQELLQSEGLEPPVYRLVGREGPDHAPVFHVECRVDGRCLASASGGSKKEAERRAAALALVGFEALSGA